jgi:hypothetical protein
MRRLNAAPDAHVRLQIMVDDTEYTSSVTLMILCDDIDPDTITKELEMFPDQKWAKGEKKSYRKNDGSKVQFEGRHEWAGWKRFIDPDIKNKPLEDQLDFWCNTLKDRKEAISRLKSIDCYCALDIFISTDQTASIIIDENIQKKLSSLMIELRISIMAND